MEIQMKKMSITKVKDAPKPFFKVQGNIIEGVGETLTEAFKGISGEIQIDLSGVTITNSLGIKEWIETMSEFGSKLKVCMLQCPPAIVHTINMIPKFIGNGTVGSVIGTFYCLNCEATKNKEINVETDIEKKGLELRFSLDCDACGHPDMQLEVSSEEYFEFLEVI